MCLAIEPRSPLLRCASGRGRLEFRFPHGGSPGRARSRTTPPDSPLPPPRVESGAGAAAAPRLALAAERAGSLSPTEREGGGAPIGLRRGRGRSFPRGVARRRQSGWREGRNGGARLREARSRPGCGAAVTSAGPEAMAGPPGESCGDARRSGRAAPSLGACGGAAPLPAGVRAEPRGRAAAARLRRLPGPPRPRAARTFPAAVRRSAAPSRPPPAGAKPRRCRVAVRREFLRRRRVGDHLISVGEWRGAALRPLGRDGAAGRPSRSPYGVGTVTASRAGVSLTSGARVSLGSLLRCSASNSHIAVTAGLLLQPFGCCVAGRICSVERSQSLRAALSPAVRR